MIVLVLELRAVLLAGVLSIARKLFVLLRARALSISAVADVIGAAGRILRELDVLLALNKGLDDLLVGDGVRELAVLVCDAEVVVISLSRAGESVLVIVCDGDDIVFTLRESSWDVPTLRHVVRAGVVVVALERRITYKPAVGRAVGGGSRF